MAGVFQPSVFQHGVFQMDTAPVVVAPPRGGRYRRGVPVFDYGQDSISHEPIRREYEAIAIFVQPAATWSGAMSLARSQDWRDMEALLGLGVL